MHTTVVIVNWNGGSMLMDCLTSIHQHAPGYRVIVVDNDSSDGSREKAQTQFPQYQIFNSGDNLGFGRANNLAREIATTEYILFLNPDTIILGNAIQEMEKTLDDMPDVGMLGCKMRYPSGEVQEQGLQLYPSPWTVGLNFLLTSKTTLWCKKVLPYLDPVRSSYVKKLYGGCLLARRSILNEIGWFDERYFMYVEDVDLCRTMISKGWELYYLSTAEIIHIAGGPSKKAPNGFSTLMMCESIEKMMRKYYGPIGSFAYRLIVLIGSTSRLFLSSFFVFLAKFHVLSDKSYAKTAGKYRTMIAWALYQQEAEPVRRSRSSEVLAPIPK